MDDVISSEQTPAPVLYIRISKQLSPTLKNQEVWGLDLLDLTRNPETHTHTGTECSAVVVQEKALCLYQPIPAANLLLSLSLEYSASQPRARGRRGTKKPSRLCQGEMRGHRNTPLPSPAMGDGAGSWRRREENKAK